MADTGDEGVGARAGRAAAIRAGQIISWFSLVGATFTAFSNLTGFIAFARWIHDIVFHWQAITFAVSRFLLNLLPFDVPDALVGPTMSLALALSLGIGVRLSGSPPTDRYPWKVVALISAGVFVFGSTASLLSVHIRPFFGPHWYVLPAILGLIGWLLLAPVLDILSRRFGFDQSIATSVFSVNLFGFIMLGRMGVLEMAISCMVTPLVLAIADADAMSTRVMLLGKLILPFVIVAMLTLLPVPEGLAISPFFDKSVVDDTGL